jgi:hypothetical protein
MRATSLGDQHAPPRRDRITEETDALVVVVSEETANLVVIAGRSARPMARTAPGAAGATGGAASELLPARMSG